jgi:hypothetical protein
MNILRNHKLAILLFLFSSVLAHASSGKTYVSVNGSDGNAGVSCPATAPCRSFNAALSVTSPYGEVVAVDSGDYDPITINQPVTIKAAPGVDATIISPWNDGITITIGTNDIVVLRGLNVNGLGGWASGIRLNAGGVLDIENCNITHFGSNGISIYAGGSTVYVKDTVAEDTSAGIFLQSRTSMIHASIDGVHLKHNNYVGLYAGANSQTTIRNSVVADSYYGMQVGDYGGTSELNVEDCLIERANTAIYGTNNFGGGTALARVNHSTIVDNGTGLSTYGVPLLSYGNNRLAGNGTDGSFTGLISLQ